MFCGYCGNKVNSSEHRFCTSCGKPLKDQEASVLDNQDVEDEYLVSPESAPPEVPSIADECISPKEEPEEKHLSSYELPPSEVLPDTYESIHSDIKPEGESIQENQNIQNSENNVPQSKYLSVTWWKESPWPWQARSLDARTLLGSYETEVEAADVVAKFHGIDRMDLMMAAVDSEKEEELQYKLRKKIIDEQWENRVTKNPEIPKPEGAVNDHTSAPAQSRIKEHIEPPAVEERRFVMEDKDENYQKIQTPGTLNQEANDRAYEQLVEFWGREPTWEEFKLAKVKINRTIASYVSGTTLMPIGYTLFFGFIMTVAGFLALPIAILLYFLGYLTSGWYVLVGLALSIFLIKTARAGQCSGILAQARRKKEVYEILMRSGAFVFKPEN
jgi:hypothetical protein